MSFLKKIVVLIFPVLLLVGSTMPLPAQLPRVREYQVKAVFLYNFTQFVEWPVLSLPAGKDPLVIGILGEDPFGPYLDEVMAGEEINGHPLLVKRFTNTNEISDCHILFINEDNKKSMQGVLESLAGRGVLTVSDQPDFIQKGGMIRFVKVNNKVQFQINPDAAKAADIKISSKLLRLAEIVTPNN